MVLALGPQVADLGDVVHFGVGLNGLDELIRVAEILGGLELVSREHPDLDVGFELSRAVSGTFDDRVADESGIALLKYCWHLLLMETVIKSYPSADPVEALNCRRNPALKCHRPSSK